jgi:hypothetical protein
MHVFCRRHSLQVRVTVARHKNNYFLGWTEDQLRQLDPIVRPRVPVTPAIYREYCHRNAMKYDSNLQFACESPEPWAAEFRRRLAMSPAEGGFTSLCEVSMFATADLSDNRRGDAARRLAVLKFRQSLMELKPLY